MDYDYNSTANYDYSDSTFVTPCDKSAVNSFGKQFLPTFYYIIFSVSLLGNGMVLYIVFKFEKLNTVTNIFLLNLVVSDLVFTSSLPFWAVYHSSEWIFGSVVCKMVGSAYFLGFYSSILFLTLMTFDRYLAVVKAVTAAQRRRSCYALVASTVVWCVSFLASSKPLFQYDVEDDDVYGLVCEDGSSKEWQLFDFYMQFVLFFLFPLAVVLYCYIRIVLTVISTRMRGKHRTVKLIFVIVVMFFICWTPYNVVLVIRDHQDSCNNYLAYAQYITHNIAHLYFGVNPIFYTFMGRKFQNHCCTLLMKHAPCLKRHLSISASSRSLSQKSPKSTVSTV